MMHSEFPVERLAQLSSNTFQIGFARQVMRMLEASDFLAYEATHEGLMMRGQNEDALAKPAVLLRDLYGDDLVLRPPQVRYMSLGNRPYEPIMLLRVRIAPRHRKAVREDLDARDVAILEEHQRPSVCVLRAEAPLRKLLGYGEALSALTGGSGLHWTWLDRYVPMDDPPGGRAA
ncbi:MAG: hypothetical protein HS112_06365 [Zoogloeaceae bacterium]|nr:hypothetical protein [Zoogloeaceae bacterium]MBP9655079.1 hypothetical protein [Rhodocyclaceae bacterium]MCC7269503.1 hypothetical protein [Rhodocyclaceae bacterium]MCL4724443.1 hypothetical protein [Rhodocyclaceae bacterium]